MREVRVKHKKLNWKNAILWIAAFFLLSNPSISIFNAISNSFQETRQPETREQGANDNSEVSNEETLNEIDFLLLTLGIFLLLYLSREPDIEEVELNGISIKFKNELQKEIDDLREEIEKERVLTTAIIDGWKFRTLYTLDQRKIATESYDVDFNDDMQKQLQELYDIGFIEIADGKSLDDIWKNVFNPTISKGELDVRKYFKISHRGESYLKIYADDNLKLIKPIIEKVNDEKNRILNFYYEPPENSKNSD